MQPKPFFDIHAVTIYLTRKHHSNNVATKTFDEQLKFCCEKTGRQLFFKGLSGKICGSKISIPNENKSNIHVPYLYQFKI